MVGDKLGLADGKAVQLPGLKRWRQENGWGQFSDSRLAKTLIPEELPSEVHEVADALVKFARLSLCSTLTRWVGTGSLRRTSEIIRGRGAATAPWHDDS